MERSTKLKYGIGILLFLILIFSIIAAVLAYFLFFTSQAQAFDGRPVVLVHKPLNNAQIPLGERVFVHATARAEDGIQRVELWVDNQLVESKESPLSASQNPLVLAAGWTPATLGRHIIVVRGISAGGVQGQATIYVFVVEPEPEIGSHTVGEGETFESIAGDYGISEDELQDLNSDLDTDRIEEGDSVDVPGGGAGPGGPDRADDEPPDGEDASSGDDDASPEGDGGDEVPPDPHAGDPSDPEDLTGHFDIDEIIDISDPEDLTGHFDIDEIIDIVDGEDSVQLVVEVLALATDSAYEGVHCFAAFAGGSHQRYPEGDGSFAPLTGESWEVASMLSGTAAPIISWYPDREFEIDITCVGISAGGTEAVDLGNLLITVMSVAWDGVTRRAVSDGEEGHFTIDYRVSYWLPEEVGDRDVDPNMTIPTNVQVAPDTHRLTWDYPIDVREPPISGFIIYMNGNLIWTVGAGYAAPSLPPEWFPLPCGESYAFEVSAYRNELPAGPQSYPSDPAVIAGPELDSPGCEREVVIDFVTLTTYDLGRDEVNEQGDMGPIYGTFYTNDETISFDETYCAVRCEEWHLNHNSEVNIDYELQWLSGQTSRLYVHIPEGEALVLGYDIADFDRGINNDDDPVCSGWTIIRSDTLDELIVGDIMSDNYLLVEPYAGEIVSDNGRCSVSFRIRLSPESLIGGPGAGLLMPRLVVEDITLESGDTTHPAIHVRNDGDASWTGGDLTIDVTNRAGEPYGRFTWSKSMLIAPGETVSLTNPGLHPEPPLDICVLLDPDNQMLKPERPEGAGAHYVFPFCADVPDLRIIDAQYDSAHYAFTMTVENASDNPIVSCDIEWVIEFTDGTPMWTVSKMDASIRPWGTIDITWTEVVLAPFPHQKFLNGYTVVVDPRNQIAEEDEDNNRYTVPASD